MSVAVGTRIGHGLAAVLPDRGGPISALAAAVERRRASRCCVFLQRGENSDRELWAAAVLEQLEQAV